MPEVNKRTFVVLGSDILFRSMYGLWATVFPKNYSCVLFLDLSMPRRTGVFLLGNWKSTHSRGRNIPQSCKPKLSLSASKQWHFSVSLMWDEILPAGMLMSLSCKAWLGERKTHCQKATNIKSWWERNTLKNLCSTYTMVFSDQD